MNQASMWNTMKHTNIWVMEVSEGKEREKGVEKNVQKQE